MIHIISTKAAQISAEFGGSVHGYTATCTCGVHMVSEIWDALDQMVDEHMTEVFLCTR